jgi:GNAT superfamily N-acetyltransferase
VRELTGTDISIAPGDPGAGAGRRLLNAMTDEIDHLYRDREGSILAISAHPGEMSPPDGAFLVISAGGEPIGCGGLKRLDADTCEIKRMYIAPAWRGRGLSRALLDALEGSARELGFAISRLDTGDRQPSARRLYLGAGYREIPDYNGNPLARFWFERAL